MGETRLAGTVNHVGIRNQTSAYGEKSNARQRTNSMSNSRPALGSVAPYNPPSGQRAKKCASNDDTCNGWRVLGSEHCTVHLKQLGKLAEWQERAKRLKELKAAQTSDELE